MNNNMAITVVRPAEQNRVVKRANTDLTPEVLQGLLRADGRPGDLVHMGSQWHWWDGKSLTVYTKKVPRRLRELVQ